MTKTIPKKKKYKKPKQLVEAALRIAEERRERRKKRRKKAREKGKDIPN